MNKLLLIALLIASPSLQASDAMVKLVLGNASAKANTPLAKGSTFSTGKKSRSEVSLPSGLFRTGSDTSVQIAGDDSLNLTKGLTLVASKPKLFRSAMRVNTPGYGMKVRGTAQIYYDPGHSIRIVALEGQVSVSLESLRGETLTIKRGQELIINPTDKRLPTPVEVDLNRLMSTMALLDKAAFPVLPSSSQISTAATTQEYEIAEGTEVDATPLIMETAGPEVEILPEEIVHEDVADEIEDLDGDGEDDPAMVVDENGVPIDTETTDQTDNADTDTANADTTGDTTDDSAPDDGTRKVGKHRNRQASKKRATNISISGQKVSANAVTIGSSTVGNRIYITNSSEVAALAGALQVLSKGGSIAIDASMLKASGEILLDTSATNAGLINLRNATLNANAIRARAFGNGTNSLVIDGTTMNATQFIKLYAEGSSTLSFRNNVTLNTPQAILAGKTVQVEAGGNVNVSGRADVYTDNAHFNQAGYGNLNAGGGVTTKPHNARPGF